MDFAFTADERAFAEEVRRFLREHPLERFPLEGMDAGYGSGAHSRAFMRALGAQGWLSMGWPRALRRPGAAAVLQARAPGRAGAGRRAVRSAGWLLADRRRHHRATAASACGARSCRRVARGDGTFWQGYSEPDAGSDLLGLKTQARRDGDEYVITTATRSGRATPASRPTASCSRAPARKRARSRGFSMFVVPNGTPGMDIRPIRSLTGEVYHYEVFLDDVRVPPTCDWDPRARASSRCSTVSTPTGSGVASTRRRPSSACCGQLVEYANTTLVRGVPLARDPGDPPPPGRRRRGRGGAARALLSRRLPDARRGHHHLRDRGRQGDGRRAGAEGCAARHGPARPVGTAARGLARGEARRADLAPLPDEPRSHDRRRHRRGAADHHRGARARLAGRAEGARPAAAAERWTSAPRPSQQLLASTARAFLQAPLPAGARAGSGRSMRAASTRSCGQRMAELGWPGLLVAPEHGGSGGSLLDVVLLVEEMGYACLPGPVHRERRRRHRAAGRGRQRGPAEATAARAGHRRAHRHAGADSRRAAPAIRPTSRSRASVPGRLTGRKLFVKDAHVADRR